MASTYAAGLRARLAQQHEKGFGQPGFQPPPEWVVERQFQEKLTSGYRRTVGTGKSKKSNRCDRCFTLKSANGTCNCE
jgi:hypothetical protein